MDIADIQFVIIYGLPKSMSQLHQVYNSVYLGRKSLIQT